MSGDNENRSTKKKIVQGFNRPKLKKNRIQHTSSKLHKFFLNDSIKKVTKRQANLDNLFLNGAMKSIIRTPAYIESMNSISKALQASITPAYIESMNSISKALQAFITPAYVESVSSISKALTQYRLPLLESMSVINKSLADSRVPVIDSMRAMQQSFYPLQDAIKGMEVSFLSIPNTLGSSDTLFTDKFSTITNSIYTTLEINKTTNAIFNQVSSHLLASRKYQSMFKSVAEMLNGINLKSYWSLLNDLDMQGLYDVTSAIKEANFDSVSIETIDNAVQYDIQQTDLLNESSIIYWMNQVIGFAKTHSSPFLKLTAIAILVHLMYLFSSQFVERTNKQLKGETSNEQSIQNSKEVVKVFTSKVGKMLIDNTLLTEFRFVSSSNLTVYSRARRKSTCLCTLNIGTIVRVAEKSRNWTRIECRDVDGFVVQGWAFTRYLKTF